MYNEQNFLPSRLKITHMGLHAMIILLLWFNLEWYPYPCYCNNISIIVEPGLL